MEPTQNQTPQPQPIMPPPAPAKSGKALAIILSIIITFIIVAGGAYAWQAYFIAPEKEQLQQQVETLTSQTEFLQQQIIDLQKEEEEEVTENIIDIPEYDLSIVLPAGITFSPNEHWAIEGMYNVDIQGTDLINAPELQIYTLDILQSYVDACVDACPEYFDTIKNFTEERYLWQNNQNYKGPQGAKFYDIKYFNGTKYAVVNHQVIDGPGYTRTYFTFLNDNTRMNILIWISDEESFQAADDFMSDMQLIIE